MLYNGICWRHNLEDKSIGKFIATLRKECGMTQKELGDKLFVSDKTISRWERGDCSPEISLLPAIAEVFSVTTDELLRGERIVVDNNSVMGAENNQVNAAQKEKKTNFFSSNKTLFIRVLAICGTIAILLAVGLILLSVVKFTATDSYDSFNVLKSALESDYDQWLKENYGSDVSAIEQANKDKMCKDTMYIPNLPKEEQYVEYYYHKDHYVSIRGTIGEDGKIVYIAVRIAEKEVGIAEIVLWSIFGANIASAVVVCLVMANKKSKALDAEPSAVSGAEKE